jgi:glycosyltransferase A (GT-A) superfamily protein (DUF2064 family)
MALQSNIGARAPEPGRYRPKNKGLAAHIGAIADATYDPIARDMLRAAVPQIARMEFALDELVAESFEQAAIDGRVQ